MTAAPSEAPRVGASAPAASGRRKVRKGTRACWECKRRKVVCVFASSDAVACKACGRRHVACVSQDMPEELSPVSTTYSRNLSERLSRVEQVMRDTALAKERIAISKPGPQAGQDRGWLSPDMKNGSRQTRPKSTQARSSAQHEDHGSKTKSSALNVVCSLDTPPSSELSCETARSPGAADHQDGGSAIDHLMRALPCKEDIKIIVQECSTTIHYISLANTQPFSKLTPERLATAGSTLQIPSSDTHPVLAARCLILLAIALQSPCGDELPVLSEPKDVLMRRLMATAATWVTNKEEMQGTVESLICIILEGVFHTHAGNLRRAWAVYRRAVTVAQLMGLHRLPKPSPSRIDPDLDADPDFLWYRIVHMDRFLSLLLGLPQCTSRMSKGFLTNLPHAAPIEKFERHLTAIASRILERNEDSFSASETATTQAIDAELLIVSASMPTEFWRDADFQNIQFGSRDALIETLRVGAQVYYHALLVQLHLPFMIPRSGGGAEHEYSRMTCVNASRDIMSAFIAHRKFNPMSSCSRPVDFFTLTSAMALLLAHIDDHQRQDAVSALAHQRQRDLAMIGQALERMNALSHAKCDVVAEESAKLIRQLLRIETEAAQGKDHNTKRAGPESNMQENETEGEELSLPVPYLGLIKISRQGFISREPCDGSTTKPQESIHNHGSAHRPPESGSQEPDQLMGQDEVSRHNEEVSFLGCSNLGDGSFYQNETLPGIMAGVDDWAFQGVDMAFFDNFLRGALSDQTWAL